MALPSTGYTNGSDLLVVIGGQAFGHCTSHTTTYNSETKDRSVKPLRSAEYSESKWKGKGVTGLSISISAEGLRFYGETEHGFTQIKSEWAAGQSVVVECFERESSTPYLSGKFIIASLEETAPADDDTTYSVSLENDGEVLLDGTSISA